MRECNHIYGAYIPPESESGGLCDKSDVLWCAKGNWYDHFSYCPMCGEPLETVAELEEARRKDG